MLEKSLSKDDLITKFAEALGREKATELIEEALKVTKLNLQLTFDRASVLEIATYLKQKGGFIGIIANCLASEAYRLENDSRGNKS